MKNNFKMPKAEDIKVSISSAFIMRARCKYCGDVPTTYFWISNSPLDKDVLEMINEAKFDKNYIKRMGGDWYLYNEPKAFLNNGYFSFTLYGKSYSPKLHKSIGNTYDIKSRDNITEMLGCECGKSFWAFNNKSVKNKPEIVNRKGRYGYNQKLVI